MRKEPSPTTLAMLFAHKLNKTIQFIEGPNSEIRKIRLALFHFQAPSLEFSFDLNKIPQRVLCKDCRFMHHVLPLMDVANM